MSYSKKLFSLIGLLVAYTTFSTCLLAQETTQTKPTVSGQLLLPKGEGSRGTQIILETEAPTKNSKTQSKQTWILFDGKGRFSNEYSGKIKRLEVVAGIDKTVHVINSRDLARLTKDKGVNIGTIDLRKRLRNHKMKLRSNAAPTVRIGMWFTKPPKDVSLGSRQFPEMKAGKETNWLVPSEFDTVYFLVEKPADKTRGRGWRSGKQKLFGPFRSSELPSELTIE